jgi:DNA repair exonuclease SbcCD nuclease subunit
MIFITGDTHGEFNRLSAKSFAEQKRMNKNDYVLICGDFGGIWGDSPSEQHWLNWLDGKPFTTLFIDGNHENFDLLSRYPIAQWCGGKAQYVREKVIHLMRGQVYKLDGKLVFTMGGARSHDTADGILEPDFPNFLADKRRLDRRGGRYRINHKTWWTEEMPNLSEYREAIKSLDNYGWRVDIIISHCAPSGLLPFLTQNGSPDTLTDFLDDIKSRCVYNKWFFGHYHQDRVIDDKHRLLYCEMIKL